MRRTVLVVGGVAAVAVLVLLAAVYIAARRRPPYRAILFALGEKSPHPKGDALRPEERSSSPALELSIAESRH